MSNPVVAKRYAEALFQLANEKNKAEAVRNELNVIREAIQEDEKLMELLNHPRISLDDKLTFIQTVFAKVDQDVLNLLNILVQRKRINNIIALIDDYIQLYNDANGIAVAEVYSVRPLKEEETANVVATFKKKFDKETIEVENIIDPSLMGGLRIRVGNTIFDGSISNKLNRFKHNLVSISK